jgi:hypothetical protein
MIPVTANDFNNFHDTFTDKFNRPCYLIYRKNFYIAQRFDENENLPMYYRRTFTAILPNKLGLREYLGAEELPQSKQQEEVTDTGKTIKKVVTGIVYNFQAGQEYYDNRPEFTYVGIIDQEPVKRRTQAGDIEFKEHDEFKIREKRPKVISKRRETGIPSFRGSVCHNSKDKEYLVKVAKSIGLKGKGELTRTSICDQIKDRMFALEKYSTGKNKMTYLIIPVNHPTIPFPLNLEDRLNHILEDIKHETRIVLDYNIKKVKESGVYPDIDYVKYIIQFTKAADKYADILKKYGAVKNNGIYEIIVE